MALREYHRKRNFRTTPEPKGRVGAAARGRAFVVQKHDARRLHYDFRLEHDGVLKSWAIPKGPSLDPGTKRLAVRTEDHPLDYAGFEGLIPEKQYGAGPVIVWDEGRWIPEDDPDSGLATGELRFRLAGSKLKGGWLLKRLKGVAGAAGGRTPENWLLIKRRDDSADSDRDLIADAPRSVKSGRDVSDLVAGPSSSTKTGFQLATLVESPPTGNDWIHEIKFDGYRAMLRIDRGRCRVVTRGGKDWTERFPAIADAAAQLRVKSAAIDGEIVVLDERGRSRFQRLQRAMSDGDGEPIFQAFDLLELDGRDLRARSLIERKEALRRILGRRTRVLRYTSHVAGGGDAMLERACALGLEGIVSKQRDATYRAARGLEWRKTKCLQRQEFVIGGFTAPQRSRVGLGALLVGVHSGGELRYSGRVGTGFDVSTLRELARRLRAIRRPDSPFVDAPRAQGIQHVEPRLVCEVAFSEWTQDGRLRHPVFLGLREDKRARDVTREEATPRGTASPRASAAKARRAPARARRRGGPVARRERKPTAVSLTHPDKVLDKMSGLTKRDLASYYEAAAPRLLPFVADRQIAIVRCPDGTAGECFFQKNRRPGAPIVVHTARDLVELAQLGVLELHPWGSRVEDIEHPDVLVLDLDPGPRVQWRQVVEAAHELRAMIEHSGLRAFAKVTGGKGVHVVVPMPNLRRLSWDEHKRFAKGIADALAAEHPDRFTANARKTARTGRIFVDYLRNGRGATAVAPDSPRARPGIPVAMPVAWNELNARLAPDRFRFADALRRLKAADPWDGYFDRRP